MYYVIIDPNLDYALYMVEFLGRHGYRAIAVFTAAHEYHAYRHMSYERIKHWVADEFLIPEHPSLEALAYRIRQEVPGELVAIIPWAELTILVGAQLGAALGLDWNPPEVIRCFRNKFAMKEALRRAGGARINASRVVSSVEDAADFVQQVRRWPIVVKPTESAGSNAVSFVNSMEELVSAAQKVFHAGAGEILLEEFIGGEEFVVNGITDTFGRLLVTDVWRYDKRDVGPHKNLYHQTISVKSYEPEWRPLAQYATQVVHALKLRKAPVHMEVKIDAFGPCMIEVGARFAGGNQPALAGQMHGRSLFELAACHYVADGKISWDDVNYERYNQHHARIISGVQTQHLQRVSGLHGYAEVQQLPSFSSFGKLIPPGGMVPVTTDLLSKCYEVYLFHHDPEQIAYDAQRVRNLLHYY